MEINFSKFEEQVFLNTVLIKNLTENEMGTGFLLKKPMSNGQVKFLLFSNKHVFWGKKFKENNKEKIDLEITLHKKELDGSYVLGTINNFRLSISKSNIDYIEHSDPNIDVACVNISLAFNQPGITLNVRAVELDKFIDFNPSVLYCGQKIIFIGYPTGFFDKTNFLPVMRSGTIASIPYIDFENKKQILIDAQVFPGSSGSPVFVEVEGQYKLLGIVSEAVIKGLDYIKIKNTAEEQEKKDQSYPIQFIGLGMVFKFSAIKEIYDSVPDVTK